MINIILKLYIIEKIFLEIGKTLFLRWWDSGFYDNEECSEMRITVWKGSYPVSLMNHKLIEDFEIVTPTDLHKNTPSFIYF
jgi:hypothetical protein